MSNIVELGYLVFEVSDAVAWDRLLVDTLGLTRGRSFPDGSKAYRLDDREMRLLVRPGPADDLVALGFEAKDEASLRAVAERARHEGVGVEVVGRVAAAARCVDEIARFREPGGVTVEVFRGAARSEAPLDRHRNEHGFVVQHQGVGHVALRADDLEASRRFFEKVLGFRLSDHIHSVLRGGFRVDVTFLHVNKRHHTIALGTGLPKHLHHFMVQTASLDDLGRTYDRCYDHGVTVTQTLGRHPNDRMLSFYGSTPSGFEFECGYGGREIDDATWVPETYDRISIWGHRRPGQMKDLHSPSVVPEPLWRNR